MAYYPPTGLSRFQENTYWPKSKDATQSYHRWGNDQQHEESTATLPPRAASPHLTPDKFIPSFERKEKAAESILSSTARSFQIRGSKICFSSWHTLPSDIPDMYIRRPVATTIVTNTCHKVPSDIPNRHIQRRVVGEAVVTNRDHTLSSYTPGGHMFGPVAAEAVVNKDDNVTIPYIKNEELKTPISKAVDAQHVAHTYRLFPNGIKCVPKTNSTSAVQAGEASNAQEDGLGAQTLLAQKQDSPSTSVAYSETETKSSLPQTPTRLTSLSHDGMSPPSQGRNRQITHSSPNFSRPCSVSPSSPTRSHFLFKAALQSSPSRAAKPLGAYTHISLPKDSYGVESPADRCTNCRNLNFLLEKPLPGLPPIHAITTNDARQIPAAPLPKTPPELASISEDEVQRWSPSQTDNETMQVDDGDITPTPSRASVELSAFPLTQSCGFQNWEEAIDYAWDNVAE